MNLSQNVNVIQFSTEVITAADSTKAYTPAVDMSGYAGVAFIAVGTSQAAAFSLYAQTAATTTATFITASSSGSMYVSSSGTTGSKDLKCLVLDVFAPTKRYVQCVYKSTGSTGVAMVDGIIAIQYGSRRPGSTSAMASTTVGGSTVLAGVST